MKSLTKENFFNELNEKFPKAMSHFCQWIDQYKISIEWHKLFPPGIKFHDLPYDMQIGIIIRYATEVKANFIFFQKDIKESFTLMMRFREYEIKYNKKV